MPPDAVSAPEAIEALVDLEGRLAQAIDALKERAGVALGVADSMRLHGKIAGVKLALSYVQEELRLRGAD